MSLVSLSALLSGNSTGSLRSSQKAVHAFPDVAENWVALTAAFYSRCVAHRSPADAIWLAQVVGHVRARSDISRPLTKWLAGYERAVSKLTDEILAAPIATRWRVLGGAVYWIRFFIFLFLWFVSVWTRLGMSLYGSWLPCQAGWIRVTWVILFVCQPLGHFSRDSAMLHHQFWHDRIILFNMFYELSMNFEQLTEFSTMFGWKTLFLFTHFVNTKVFYNKIKGIDWLGDDFSQFCIKIIF